MMAIHETGHVLHAWASGGTVSAVRVPLLGFSITEFSTNPHPHFVAWGGAVWGSLLPLLASALFTAFRWRIREAAQFFAGFCLIANGAYLGVGWAVAGGGAGDAGDLVRLGTPVTLLVAFGAAAVAAGLFLWHRLGALPPLRTAAEAPSPAPYDQ